MEVGRRKSSTVSTMVWTGDRRVVGWYLTALAIFTARHSMEDPSRARKAVAARFTNSYPNRKVGNSAWCIHSMALTDQREVNHPADWRSILLEICMVQPAAAAT